MSDAARILDQGYRRYDGERQGVAGAMRTVVLFSIGRVLGVGRGFWPKVLPIVTIGFAFTPAIVFVGLAVMVSRFGAEDLISYGEYYGFITLAVIIFAAFVAPELLCPDRRTRMLGLYLASPLDRMTYLASKGIAVLVVLSIVTVAPPLLMLVANSLVGNGPESVAAFLGLLWRIIVAGAAIAGILTSLSLAVSSFTDRNGFASAAVILILMLSSVVANALVEGAGLADELLAFDLFSLPFELVIRIYEEGEPEWPQLSTAFVAAANAAWTALFLGIVVWRYQRIEVTR